MTWIRFESHMRFHAVKEEFGGRYRTWCDRFASKALIVGEAEAPDQRCRGCVSRIARVNAAKKRGANG